ncbi:MAG: DUF1156 domain-containing protein [wastewater metagenome]|nr:DUF1156 domain-containing protein [Candidatus Loosdrechtia aerotolerans]
MNDITRLIERAFPLKQASLDSVHEKNVRHGHISTLHIWPARRPLAACRAALIATLLPDPGTPEKRKELCEKIGGKIDKKIEKKKMPNGQIVERLKEVTKGGILHWGRETEDKELLEWFRQEIRNAYGGRAPKVLDPFAGGGAIPLEAMRLGCEVTAIDINPVAWFILKCTLEYPQKLAGKVHPLPDFILENEEFMEAFYKAHPHLVGRTKPTKKQLKDQQRKLWKTHREDNERIPKADLSWHVRAWGYWVLDKARRELAMFYPTYAEFEPVDKLNAKPYEKQPIQLVPIKEDGTPDINALNKEFSKEYLDSKRNPRWIAKPTVAYLWARTVICKNCRATIPLLKTRWLCKKDKKRILLTMEPNADKSGVVFGINPNVPIKGGNTAQRREHDKRIGAGTMSRSGAKCPCCDAIMTMEDIRLEGKAGRLKAITTAVVVDGQNGKEYRLPTLQDFGMFELSITDKAADYNSIPLGLLEEPITPDAKGSTWCIQYGVDKFFKLYTYRQLMALNKILGYTCSTFNAASNIGYSQEWREAIISYLQLAFDRLTSFTCNIVRWKIDAEAVVDAFARFGLPLVWDFAEAVPINSYAGGYPLCFERIALGLEVTTRATFSALPKVITKSAISFQDTQVDLIVTDPPYYDSISYAGIMDFFYVWIKRGMNGMGQDYDKAFLGTLSTKWNHEKNDGELIDDARRFGGNRSKSKAIYEEGMARAFKACNESLKPDGRMVIVFANKQPAAWETLVSAIIRSGFVVNGSWPIQTEMISRARALGSSALASSLWLICKKRPSMARSGWDNQVIEEMRQNIKERLREYWDAGIRGPDFVWAATGPALEAYSKHPIVKKANEPGILTVNEFLNHVRRIVVDFVVGRVLSRGKEGDAELAAADHLDEPTAYYLLHRNDFGLEEAPAGACILYAISCGISDKELADTCNLISFTKGKSTDGSDEEETDVDAEADEIEKDSGSKVKLKTWAQRKSRSLGCETSGGKPIPLIDRVHCLMHLWKEGDLHKVDAYLDDNGLRRHELFKRLLQSLIELSPHGSEERSLLESLSNHIQAKGAVAQKRLSLPHEE